MLLGYTTELLFVWGFPCQRPWGEEEEGEEPPPGKEGKACQAEPGWPAHAVADGPGSAPYHRVTPSILEPGPVLEGTGVWAPRGSVGEGRAAGSHAQQAEAPRWGHRGEITLGPAEESRSGGRPVLLRQK